jgi:hypothetical protein
MALPQYNISKKQIQYHLFHLSPIAMNSDSARFFL